MKSLQHAAIAKFGSKEPAAFAKALNGKFFMQHNLTHYSGTACCNKYELAKSQFAPSRTSFIIAISH